MLYKQYTQDLNENAIKLTEKNMLVLIKVQMYNQYNTLYHTKQTFRSNTTFNLTNIFDEKDIL